MIRQEIKQLKTGARELRKFGLLVGAVFAALGLLFWWRHKGHPLYFLWPGILLMIFGAAVPGALKYIYIAWMSFAIVLGFIVSNVLLTVFFILVITPIGLVARLFGKDFLGLKLDRKAPTYWIPRKSRLPGTASDYTQQF